MPQFQFLQVKTLNKLDIDCGWGNDAGVAWQRCTPEVLFGNELAESHGRRTLCCDEWERQHTSVLVRSERIECTTRCPRVKSWVFTFECVYTHKTYFSNQMNHFIFVVLL